jgi:hypothetical protein
MKKYKPFEKIPASIVGKTIVSKNGDGAYMVEYVHRGNVSLFGWNDDESADILFNDYTFVDGSPIGEEYEDVAELIHDKAYCVRCYRNDDWVVRYFDRILGDCCEFYNDGGTSLSQKNTTRWDQVSEYDEDIVGKIVEPKNGYLFNARNEQ